YRLTECRHPSTGRHLARPFQLVSDRRGRRRSPSPQRPYDDAELSLRYETDSCSLACEESAVAGLAIITEACIDVKDRACVDVCPVQCIYELDPRKNLLFSEEEAGSGVIE